MGTGTPVTRGKRPPARGPSRLQGALPTPLRGGGATTEMPGGGCFFAVNYAVAAGREQGLFCKRGAPCQCRHTQTSLRAGPTESHTCYGLVRVLHPNVGHTEPYVACVVILLSHALDVGGSYGVTRPRWAVLSDRPGSGTGARCVMEG